jgi:hypothetical protein
VKYRIISNPSPIQLEIEVNDAISAGYELIGPPFMGPYDYLYQAVTKGETHE